MARVGLEDAAANHQLEFQMRLLRPSLNHELMLAGIRVDPYSQLERKRMAWVTLRVGRYRN